MMNDMQISDRLEYFRTTQENIVIPTNELIKKKGSNIIVLACISAISNVDIWDKSGENSRYCSVSKINNNLNSISKITGMDRAKIIREVRKLVKFGSDEFKEVIREYNGKDVVCAEINYKRGGFITISCETLERLLWNRISQNAFKLYINLLWLCKDNVNDRFIEKKLNQEYLLQLIGLSSTSARSIRKAEEELINLNLIKIRTEWEKGLTTLSEVSNPIRKKYYKVLCT